MSVIAEGEGLGEVLWQRDKLTEVPDPGLIAECVETDGWGRTLISKAQNMGGKGGGLYAIVEALWEFEDRCRWLGRVRGGHR